MDLIAAQASPETGGEGVCPPGFALDVIGECVQVGAGTGQKIIYTDDTGGIPGTGTEPRVIGDEGGDGYITDPGEIGTRGGGEEGGGGVETGGVLEPIVTPDWGDTGGGGGPVVTGGVPGGEEGVYQEEEVGAQVTYAREPEQRTIYAEEPEAVMAEESYAVPSYAPSQAIPMVEAETEPEAAMLIEDTMPPELTEESVAGPALQPLPMRPGEEDPSPGFPMPVALTSEEEMLETTGEPIEMEAEGGGFASEESEGGGFASEEGLLGMGCCG
jgi:hypothetical protein